MNDHDLESFLAELDIYWPSNRKDKPLPTIDELKAMSFDEREKMLKKAKLDNERAGFLVHDPQKRKQGAEKRQKQVLDYLRSEPYSSLEVLSELLGVTLAGARKIVMRMVNQRLVVKDEIAWMGKRKMHLYGISATGLYDLLDADAPEPNLNHCYHRGKYRITYVKHTLVGQLVRLKLTSKSGIGPWINERHLPYFDEQRGSKLRWEEYPDAILENSPWRFKGDNRAISAGIEIEREPKSRARYKKIISAHLDNIDEDRYGIVVYYVDGDRAVKRTKKLFDEILDADRRLKIYHGSYASDDVPTGHFVVRSYRELLTPETVA